MMNDAQKMEKQPAPECYIKVITGNSTNFARVIDHNELEYLHTRPMLVNSWTQTQEADFNMLCEQELQCRAAEKNLQQQQENKTVQMLMDKIKVLEESLKAHSELLSQIQNGAPGSGEKTAAVFQDHNEDSLHTMAVAASNCLPIQPQQQNAHKQGRPEVLTIQRHQRSISSTDPAASSHIIQNSHMAAVKNPLQQIQNSNSTPTQSIKYTIITEGSGGSPNEPIEVELAPEDDEGAMNLNSSADSNRLEICLNEEHNINSEPHNLKTEYLNVFAGSENCSIATPVIKRRRMDVARSEPGLRHQGPHGYYYVNERGAQDTKPPLGESKHNIINNLPSFNSFTTTGQVGLQRQSLPGKVETHVGTERSLLNANYHAKPGNHSFREQLNPDNVLVSIGPNNTRISANVYESINWSSASIATRKLLMAVFDREVLATHSMTGKPSPAFKNHGKPLKEMLDKNIVQDIIYAVTHRCTNATEKEVRNAITTKCADENKMMKLKLNKNASQQNLMRTKSFEFDKENENKPLY